MTETFQYTCDLCPGRMGAFSTRNIDTWLDHLCSMRHQEGVRSVYHNDLYNGNFPNPQFSFVVTGWRDEIPFNPATLVKEITDDTERGHLTQLYTSTRYKFVVFTIDGISDRDRTSILETRFTKKISAGLAPIFINWMSRLKPRHWNLIFKREMFMSLEYVYGHIPPVPCSTRNEGDPVSLPQVAAADPPLDSTPAGDNVENSTVDQQ